MEIPEELKYLTPYIQRGQELDSHEPIVAYYAYYYAVKLAIGRGPSNKITNNYLSHLLDTLEQKKQALGTENEAINDDLVGYAHLENFALKVFMSADNEDRLGRGSKKTAKTFLAASVFLELLKTFGELDPEVEGKIKYAKWKAADIIKAIREGQVPTPGVPGEQHDETMDHNTTHAQPTTMETTETAANVIQPPLPLPLPPTLVPAISDFPSPPSNFTAPLTSSSPSKPPNGIGNLPSQSPSKSTTTSSSSPPPTVASSPPPSDVLSPTTPPSHSAANTNIIPQMPPDLNVSSPRPSTSTHTSPPPPPSHQPQPQQQQRSFDHEPAAPLTSQPPTTTQVGPIQIAAAQKNAKWAISALNYDDIKTARTQLLDALHELGYNMQNNFGDLR